MNILTDIWGNNIVTGISMAYKPDILCFKYSNIAIDMLNKHIKNRGKIAIHCDVDMDGIGSGYIMSKFLASQGCNNNNIFVINSDKVHGVNKKHLEALNNKNIDLLIILDSSSNDIDIIKAFDMDVIVIDHHELIHSDLYGYNIDGKHKFVIVNNTIDNNDVETINEWILEKNKNNSINISKYIADDRMSCGLVVYELLRLYSSIFNIENTLENLMLYQWVGITLFTDSVLLNNLRNQWYIENTIYSDNTEYTLRKILEKVNSYKVYLDKSTINYTIAPIVNKTIRAGFSAEAMNTILFNPEGITELNKYKELQDTAIEVGINNVEIYDYIIKDMTEFNISSNYNGVIASKLCGMYNKSTVVFKVNNGIAAGSFRGRRSDIDYRVVVDNFDDTTWAQGHKSAFGFGIPIEKIHLVMKKLIELENNIDNTYKYLLTAGKLNFINPGKYQINDLNEFRKQGGIWQLGIGNSKLSSEEQIMITVSSDDARLIEQQRKVYIYDILGFVCKAFSPIVTPVVNIYIEYSRQIDCYVK